MGHKASPSSPLRRPGRKCLILLLWLTKKVFSLVIILKLLLSSSPLELFLHGFKCTSHTCGLDWYLMGSPKTPAKNNMTDFPLLLIPFIFSASCLEELYLWGASDHILCLVWFVCEVGGESGGTAGGPSVCVWGTDAPTKNTACFRTDETKNKAKVTCCQLDVNISMFLWSFKIINKHLGGMKENTDLLINFTHTFPQSGSDVRCPTPSTHNSSSKRGWKWSKSVFQSWMEDGVSSSLEPDAAATIRRSGGGADLSAHVPVKKQRAVRILDRTENKSGWFFLQNPPQKTDSHHRKVLSWTQRIRHKRHLSELFFWQKGEENVEAVFHFLHFCSLLKFYASKRRWVVCVRVCVCSLNRQWKPLICYCNIWFVTRDFLKLSLLFLYYFLIHNYSFFFLILPPNSKREQKGNIIRLINNGGFSKERVLMKSIYRWSDKCKYASLGKFDLFSFCFRKEKEKKREREQLWCCPAKNIFRGLSQRCQFVCPKRHPASRFHHSPSCTGVAKQQNGGLPQQPAEHSGHPHRLHTVHGCGGAG